MLEGVLKELPVPKTRNHGLCFNPWYVGGGVKRPIVRKRLKKANCFNPWYVGGGVKSCPRTQQTLGRLLVSILGMLEGVLKAKKTKNFFVLLMVSILGMLEGVLKVYINSPSPISRPCFNPWYVGGGVKRAHSCSGGAAGKMFQSLVCWRGC